MPVQNVVLIGMPGSGKSTVGALLAKRRELRLLDTDTLMMERFGKSLQQLVAEEGVEAFLRMEGLVGESVRCEGRVIATGGSMVYSEAAMRNLKSLGPAVWLDVPLAELEGRVALNRERGIAAAKGQSLAQIEAARRPLYQRYADMRVSGEGCVRETVRRIEAALRDWEQQHIATGMR